MANNIRLKRRAAGGAAGAPASLLSAEPAYNEQDNILYYGFGDSGGNATSIIPIGGSGAFTTLNTTQTVTGDKTFSGVISLTGSGASSPTAVTQSVNDNSTRLATTAFVLGQGNSTAGTIAMNGAQAAGTSNLYARADHVHPTDTSRAPLASPTFTGTPAAPTAAADTNTTQLATTAFVLGQASSVAGAALGTAAVGTSLRYARADHVHAMPTLSQVGNATADRSMSNFKITNLADPVNAQDAATKAYVDAARSGLDVKESCRVATTATAGTYNSTGGTSARGQLTAAPNTIDGVTLAANNRILVKDHTTAAANGIYVVTTVGTGANGVWDRATDFDSDVEVTASAFTFVSEGTANANSGWVVTSNDPVTIGGASGSAITWAQFSGAGQIDAGNGLTKTGNQLNVVTASSARIVVNADNIDLATTGVGASTYRSVTVDVYGRVTAGTNPTTLAGYGITDAQPLDATLTALAGVATVADRLIYATASDTFTTTVFTSFGRSLVDDADATAGRTTLGLGTMATQNANNVNITGGVIDNITIDGGTF